MKPHRNSSHIRASVIVAGLALAVPAFAHLTYTNRNFGSFDGTVNTSVTIINQTITGNAGWADGTDDDFGDSHHLRGYRFNMTGSGWVTITATASTNPTSATPRLGDLNPGFSIFSGLAAISPFTAPQTSADYDTSLISLDYLATLPGVPKEGAYRSLGNWAFGGDGETDFANLSNFAYIGNKADGTSANYGSAPGIKGDGSLDGTVTGSFFLTPGDYTLLVGGTNYSGQADLGVRGVTVNLVVPEPSTYALGAGILALAVVALRRRLR